jgi:hypothetical protein
MKTIQKLIGIYHISVPPDLISPDTWIDHFNSLNNNNDTFTDRIQTITKQVENLEKLRCSNELDMKITEGELSKAIKKVEKY